MTITLDDFPEYVVMVDDTPASDERGGKFHLQEFCDATPAELHADEVDDRDPVNSLLGTLTI